MNIPPDKRAMHIPHDPEHQTGDQTYAYVIYEAMGPARNLKQLARTLEKDPARVTQKYQVLRKWSTQLKWQTRVSEFDKMTLAKMRKALDDDLLKMNKRHLQYARETQVMVFENIKRLIAEKDFSAMASVKIFEFAVQLERIILNPAEVDRNSNQIKIHIEYVNDWRQPESIIIDEDPLTITSPRSNSGTTADETFQLVERGQEMA